MQAWRSSPPSRLPSQTAESTDLELSGSIIIIARRIPTVKLVTNHSISANHEKTGNIPKIGVRALLADCVRHNAAFPELKGRALTFNIPIHFDAGILLEARSILPDIPRENIPKIAIYMKRPILRF